MGCEFGSFRKVVCLMLADQGLCTAPPLVDSALTEVLSVLRSSFLESELAAVESALAALDEHELDALAVGEQGEWPPLLERLPEQTHSMLDEIFMQIGG